MCCNLDLAVDLLPFLTQILKKIKQEGGSSKAKLILIKSVTARKVGLVFRWVAKRHANAQRLCAGYSSLNRYPTWNLLMLADLLG